MPFDLKKYINQDATEQQQNPEMATKSGIIVLYYDKNNCYVTNQVNMINLMELLKQRQLSFL